MFNFFCIVCFLSWFSVCTQAVGRHSVNTSIWRSMSLITLMSILLCTLILLSQNTESSIFCKKKIDCFDIYFMVLWKKFVMGFMHKKWFKENVNVNVLVLRLSQEFFSDHYLLKKLLLTVIWKLTDLIDLPWNRCPVEGCGMSFRFPSVLKRHSKVHEGKCQTIWW